MIAALGGACGVAAAALLAGGAFYGAMAVAFAALVLLLLFSTLTVRVDDRQIEARFGIGVLKKRIALGEVRSYRAVRNSWLAGWGIRIFPGGVIYNVSGLDAVELELASGRRVRIGTDEPDALVNAISQVAGPSHAPRSLEERGFARRGSRALVLVLVGALAIPVTLGILFAREMRDPRVEVDRHQVEVSSTLYSASVPLADVVSVTLVTTPPPRGVRTNGFALGGALRGHFRLQGYGDGMVFANRNVPPYVLLRTRTGYLLLGLGDPARTRALYQRINQARSP